MKAVHAIAFILVVIGGLNWGLIAINGNYNVVAAVLGDGSVLARIVYALVGVSAIYLAIMHKKDCKCCEASATTTAPQA